MISARQLSLFPEPDVSQAGDIFTGKDLGTFRDSMRAPVHRWFRYPAGFSYKFVFESFDVFGIQTANWVYDPFSGTGTTLICAKQRGLHAYGVEAHSFVHFVAETKLYWEFDLAALSTETYRLFQSMRDYVQARLTDITWQTAFPELVYKCYHPEDLKTLYWLREFIEHDIDDVHIRNLFKLALTDTLRSSAAAGTGWPYIAPRKNTGNAPPKNALKIFEQTAGMMLSDLRTVAVPRPKSTICSINGDSREKQHLENNQVSLVLTSPPYLNNYDYADRTRLETYFWGITNTWHDISRQFRDKLITAATTQINRGDYDVETTLTKELHQIAPDVYSTLQTVVLELDKIRLSKGGKKSYDLMVALYFKDMLKVMQETYRVVKPGGHFCLVLGDSAPYGIHIRTDELIGKIGLGLGFRRFDYHELRGRGEKWRDNPQRHHVPLREGIVILQK